jgi:hypothetical protein
MWGGRGCFREEEGREEGREGRRERGRGVGRRWHGFLSVEMETQFLLQFRDFFFIVGREATIQIR